MLATLRETKHMIASLQEKEKRLKAEVGQLHEEGKLDHLVDKDDPQKFNGDGLSVSLCKGPETSGLRRCHSDGDRRQTKGDRSHQVPSRPSGPVHR